jgi:hypothetical protein
VSRTVVVHQPDFLPYLGFFHRLVHADVYIALDHVQFVQRTANAWTHRDKIKTRRGEAWLSLSVRKCPIDTPIMNVELSEDAGWRHSNLNLLRENYRHAPYFDAIFEKVEALYRAPMQTMVSLNLAFIDLLCGWLLIDIKRLRSSAMAPAGSKSDMVAGLVSAAGGTRYLSGVGARAYHLQAPFDSRGIEVAWQSFDHPVYPQQFGPFIPYLSAVDALFNCGPEATANMLRRI